MRIPAFTVLAFLACAAAPAQTVYRPTTYTYYDVDPLSATSAYDNSLSSYADYVISTDDNPGNGQYTTYLGWTNPTGSRSSVTLKILDEVDVSDGSGTEGLLKYSLDGGKTWSIVFSMLKGVPRSYQWDTRTLPVDQDLSRVQVYAFEGAKAPPATGVMNILLYDIEIAVN